MSWARVRCPIKTGLHQSRTSWYPVITDSSYKVAVLVMSFINYITHQYANATQNTPHKTSPGEGLQSSVALSSYFLCWRYPIPGTCKAMFLISFLLVPLL